MSKRDAWCTSNRYVSTSACPRGSVAAELASIGPVHHAESGDCRHARAPHRGDGCAPATLATTASAPAASGTQVLLECFIGLGWRTLPRGSPDRRLWPRWSICHRHYSLSI